MGLVSDEEAVKGLRGALKFFRDNISRLNSIASLSLFEAYFMIMVLGAYFYSKYYRCGRPKKSEYSIVSGNIRELYIDYDEELATLASSIIVARNTAAHVPYIDESDNAVWDVLNNVNLIRLLRCEGIINKSGNFIEPEDGCYYSVSGVEEAKAMIKESVDRINREDNEVSDDSEVKVADFMSAVSKMQGN